MTLGGPCPEVPPSRPISSEWQTSGGTPKKPGFKTSEFWIAVLVILVGAAMLWRDKDEIGLMLIFGAAAPYSISRGLAKR